MHTNTNLADCITEHAGLEGNHKTLKTEYSLDLSLYLSVLFFLLLYIQDFQMLTTPTKCPYELALG